MLFEQINNTYVKLEGHQITMAAGKGTNLFNGVSGTWKCTSFPYHFTRVKGDFLIRCKVAVDFRAVYDLGSLVIFEDPNKWLKFAFENSDTGVPSIVSVVTDGISDDCNGEPIQNESVWLQICRQGSVFAMHYSLDKISWKLARICRLNMSEEVMAGVSAQCPQGLMCVAYFSEFEITANPYEDIRQLK